MPARHVKALSYAYMGLGKGVIWIGVVLDMMCGFESSGIPGVSLSIQEYSLLHARECFYRAR